MIAINSATSVEWMHHCSIQLKLKCISIVNKRILSSTYIAYDCIYACIGITCSGVAWRTSWSVFLYTGNSYVDDMVNYVCAKYPWTLHNLHTLQWSDSDRVMIGNDACHNWIYYKKFSLAHSSFSLCCVCLSFFSPCFRSIFTKFLSKFNYALNPQHMIVILRYVCQTFWWNWLNWQPLN